MKNRKDIKKAINFVAEEALRFAKDEKTEYMNFELGRLAGFTEILDTEEGYQIYSNIKTKADKLLKEAIQRRYDEGDLF